MFVQDEELDNDLDFDPFYHFEESPHAALISNDAINCIDAFFHDKKYWAGGPIPKDKLTSQDTVKLVSEMELATALEIAYRCLEDNVPENWNTDEEDWDMKLCYKVLGECPKRFIPKCYVGGILLLNLAVCHGVDFVRVMKEYSLLMNGRHKTVI